MPKPIKRGLNAILADIDEFKTSVKTEEKIFSVPISRITPNPNQPRKTFNEESLIELSESIKQHGIIQPIVVKRNGEGYMIIAGERRYKASQMAGLVEVPIIIKEFDEITTREVSLVENLQREDLNPIEEAEAIRELMALNSYTQEEVASKLGKSRPAIANSIRLLNLSNEVIELVRANKLEVGHARALCAISDSAAQIAMAKKIIDEDWTVRRTEKEVKFFNNPSLRPKKLNDETKEKLSVEMRRFAADMNRVFATKVKIVGNDQKGRISIDYYNSEDLQRIYDLIELLKKEKNL